MAEDADDAVDEAASGTVRFGYYTSVVLLFDEDLERSKPPRARSAGASSTTASRRASRT